MELGIEGRVALVLGASRGLGRAVRGNARARGCKGRARESRSRANRRGCSIGRSARPAARSAGSPRIAATPTGCRRSPRRWQPRSVRSRSCVTNTGGPPFGDPLGFGPDDWEAAYRNLVLAPLALVNAVVPAMRQVRWGRIVNITSIATKEPVPGLILSNSHRLAAVGAFKTLADALAPDGSC